MRRSLCLEVRAVLSHVRNADNKLKPVLITQTLRTTKSRSDPLKKIGTLDGLELLPMQAPRPPEEPRFPIARIRQLCGLLGLGFNKINGRIVITRKTYTEKSKTKCQADL